MSDERNLLAGFGSSVVRR